MATPTPRPPKLDAYEQALARKLFQQGNFTSQAQAEQVLLGWKQSGVDLRLYARNIPIAQKKPIVNIFNLPPMPFTP